ncbi:MAG TPA: carboxypeptidase regulatory-like domain-containing protein [Bryobacteraceae bacterium]|nr:carboxypeptidase regulatory-like domain-containing protein [Bryobacteraceae bacterium]
MSVRCMLCLALSCAWSLQAQSIGAALSGTVEDLQRLPVQRAAITLIDANGGRTTVLVSDTDGRWRAASLAPGTYRLTVSAPEFEPAELAGIELTVGETRAVSIVLKPAGRADSVTVVAAAPALDSETSSRSASINQTLMSELPMVSGGVGRNFRTQVYLAPGVAPSTAAHRPFAVSGSRNRNNNYLIDSNDFNEVEGGLLMGRGASEQLISTEAIAGMQVLTHNFKAEYGRQSGSVISIVTRRGSNSWNGLLYEYLRNSALDARNTFDSFRPPLRSNQFGANLGGPVRRDTTFFFVNSEWLTRRQTSATTVQTVPLALRSSAVPAVARLVELYPEPNLGTNLYRANVGTAGDQHSMVLRLDHQISAAQQITVRSTVLASENRGVAGAAQQRYNTTVVPQGHSVQHTFVPGAAAVNELRLNYTRFTLNDTLLDAVGLGDPAVNGLVGTVNVTGLSQLGQFAFMARQNAQNNYQVTDDFTLVAGRHSWKTGVALRRLHLNSGTQAPSFTGALRFNSMADFLGGRAVSYTRNTGNPYLGLRATEFNIYLQDDWRVNDALTVNLGVRYEYNSVPGEVNGLIDERYRYRPDRNNIAPRSGFAWSLGRDRRTVLRGGYGLYYNVLELSFVGLTRFNPPLIASYNAVSPTFPDLLANARQAIPSGLVLPDRELRQPYSQHMNLTLERQVVNSQTTVSIGWVGTLGRKLPRVSRPNGGDGLPQSQRPDPSVGVVNRLETATASSYNGLQTSFNTQWKQLTVRAAYTWSRFLDEVSDFPSSNTGIERGLLALDERNWRLNRGRSDFDLPHAATFAWVYDIPALSRNIFLTGWSIQGLTTLQSGRPFSVFSGTDTPDGNNSNRATHIPGSLMRTPSQRQAIALAPGITPAALMPAPGQFGTIGRNTESGDSLVSWNVSVGKGFAIADTVRLQFRAEAFNVANTTNYNPPDGVLASPTFGQATSALDPRQIQIAARLTF